MHILLKGQIFRRRQRHARRGDTLDRRVVRQIGKDDGAVDGAGAPEVLNEVLALLKGDADGGKHNGERLVRAEHAGLPRDLRRQRRMGQTGAGKDRQLLAADERIEPVDGGNACLDKLRRVGARRRVHGQTVDVLVFFRQDRGAAVDRLAHAIEHAAKHILAHAELQRMAEKANLGFGQIDALRRFKKLHHGAVAVDLEHLAAALFAGGKLDLRQLVVGHALDVLDDHQGACDLPDRFVFLYHCSSPFAITPSICACISSAMR